MKSPVIPYALKFVTKSASFAINWSSVAATIVAAYSPSPMYAFAILMSYYLERGDISEPTIISEI